MMAPEGFDVRSERWGRFSAARQYAYLGTVDKVRTACINWCGEAPSDSFIQAEIDKRNHRLSRIDHPSDSYKPHDGHYPADTCEKAEKVNNAFLKALNAAQRVA